MSNRIVKQAGLLQAEIDRLRAALMAWENREGSCCPEGVPFEKVIEKLRAELEAAKTKLAHETASYDAEFERANALQADWFKALEEREAAKRENAQLAASLVRIVRFPIHSEPTGGAYAMQDIARAALSNVCPECGGTGGVDSGGSTPWGAPINLPCPSCEATRKENSIALRELLLPAINLLQLAISRTCWPHEEIVHKELSRLRSLCGEEAQV